jgi:hypothetical protein
MKENAGFWFPILDTNGDVLAHQSPVEGGLSEQKGVLSPLPLTELIQDSRCSR